MEVIHQCREAHRRVWSLRAKGQTVGLVPTMGALHEGHLSLVRQSVGRCDATFATIFVNPTQFGPQEDLARYPRTLPNDCDLLADAGVHGVLVPSVDEMYPEGFSTHVDPPEVARSLEGMLRPNHFRGVTTIVLKIFQILPATHAFFGRKDYQQLKVIEAMTRDLNLDIEIVPGDTVRQSDGLALSSRNRYLTGEHRSRALALHRALDSATRLVAEGTSETAELEIEMRQVLSGVRGADGPHRGVDKIDYAVVVDAQTLHPIDRIERPAVALIAAHVGTTRLIDNQILPLPQSPKTSHP